jgi:hypothetical protein
MLCRTLALAFALAVSELGLKHHLDCPHFVLVVLLVRPVGVLVVGLSPAVLLLLSLSLPSFR